MSAEDYYERLRARGNPAFPTFDGDVFDGMTLEDWFAGQAMAALISGRIFTVGDPPDTGEKHVARISYLLAKYMLKERQR